MLCPLLSSCNNTTSVWAGIQHPAFHISCKAEGFPFSNISPWISAFFSQAASPNNTMLLEVRHSILRAQAFFYMDMTDSQPHAGMEREREEREERERRGLTQGFEKFIKILTLLHLPGAGKVRHVCWGWVQGLLIEPVPRCDACLPLFPPWFFSPSSSLPVLLSPLLWAHTVTPKCFSGLLLYIYILFFFPHTLSPPLCVSVCRQQTCLQLRL